MENNTLNISKNPPQTWGIFCFVAILLMFGVSAKTVAQAKLKFEDPKKNFGFVKKGEIVSLEYDFTNEGNEPLLITDAKAECSCTSVEFPKQPIAPGQKQKITVKFDTKSVYDRQDRIVEVFSNSKNSPGSIRFKGVVLKK